MAGIFIHPLFDSHLYPAIFLLIRQIVPVKLLGYIDFTDSNFHGATLNGSDMTHANLTNVNFGEANLCDAELYRANLSGANLKEANLLGANLYDAIFDSKTLLPDSKLIEVDGVRLKDEDGGWVYDKYWNPQTDMSRYTNPDHPDFFEPDRVKRQREYDNR